MKYIIKENITTKTAKLNYAIFLRSMKLCKLI